MGKKHDLIVAAKSLNMPTGVGIDYARVRGAVIQPAPGA